MRARSVAALLALAIAAVVIGQLATHGIDAFRNGPRGPRGSSYATGPTGLSRYAALLKRSGYTVTRRRQPLDVDTPVNPAATLVTLDAEHLAPEEGAAIRRFVAAGGRAVVGGTAPNSWLPQVLADAPAWVKGGQPACHAIISIPESARVTDVVLTSAGHFADQSGTLAFLACNGRISASVASPNGGTSPGRVVLLSDSGPLQNQFIAARDDARLGLDILGHRRDVVFAEQVHGFGASTGIFGLPARGLTAVAVALLALLLAVAAMISRPRSGGPALEPLSAGRLELATSLGRRLERSRPLFQAAVPIQRAGRAALARRAGLPASAELDDRALRAAAVRVDLSRRQIEALLDPPHRRGDVLAAARTLTALNDPSSRPVSELYPTEDPDA